jgi:glycogen debranching enzyme
MGKEAAVRAVAERAEPAAPGGQLHVLKHDDLFAVFDARGDFHGALHAVGPSMGADGLFQDDTRVLSKLVLRIQGAMPELLSGDIGRDNVVFTAHLTNPAFHDRRNRLVPRAEIFLLRRRLLWQRKLYEALLVKSFAAEPAVFDLTLEAEADFRDVFEIRGMTRARRGEAFQPCSDGNCLTFSYRGLDGQVRTTSINFSAPVAIRHQRIVLPIELKPGATRHILMTIASDGDTTMPSRADFFTALKRSKREARRHIRALNRLETSNAAFDAWAEQAAADLSLLVTDLETGPYPYAGIPWFSVPFGRDAVVTALQVLWINPALARGVLAFLSALQAAESSAFHDAEPGKIMHETRKGEMAALREVPFGRYYGGADTTPLFVLLAGAYLKRTNDVDFCRKVWPAVRAALEWIDGFGDADRDGLIEYSRGAAGGLQNQGWKDSDNSVFHSDGRLAQGPIALVEVQAYVVAAKRAAAGIANAVGETEFAGQLATEADRLQAEIDARFWSDALGTYAIALDGDKAPCAIRTSNAGHVLYCGAAEPGRARRVGRDLMTQDLFSGWGVRTVASDASLYNPMSYHNGTVWPHDCSIVAAGLARYGMSEEAGRIFTGLFGAACHFPDFRLPELFCGFPRHAGEGPVAYPSACTPQAWASGSLFLLLQALLGIEIDAQQGTVAVRSPFLPEWLSRVTVKDLTIGEGRATLHFRREKGGVEVGLSDVEGDVRLVSLGAGNAGS